jgi:hypothetical protein
LRLVGDVIQDAKITSHVAKRFFGDGEFAEVVTPDILAGAAPGVGLAGYGAEGSVGFATEEGLGRDEEGDVLACLPEVAGKLVREEENIVAALLGEGLCCMGGVYPRQVESADVPTAKLKAVETSLSDEKLDEFKFRHRMRRTWTFEIDVAVTGDRFKKHPLDGMSYRGS